MKIGKLSRKFSPVSEGNACKYSLLLAYPSQIRPDGRIHKSKRPMMYGLALPIIAGMTPPDFKIRILDELIDDINFDEHYDLVGLSVTTVNAPRAYQIGDEFRKRGVKVVMGGMHPTVMPEDTLKHCDAVVIGEAENAWQELIEDFKTGRLKQVYKYEPLSDLSLMPTPRRDLIRKDSYEVLFEPVQTTRGCPHACEFCAVTKFFGGTYRFRPVDKVIEDIKSIEGKYIFFVDDNIAANARYSRELFEALIPLKIKWIGQANITITNNPELVKLASRSGCVTLFIGVESINKKSLEAIGKSFNNVDKYREAFKILRENGIITIASMIMGLDQDDVSVFDNTVAFLLENKVPLAHLYYPVPYPGTDLYSRLSAEGRILHQDWSNYIQEVVFQPKGMSVKELEDGLWKSYQQIYSLPSIIKRLLIPPHRNLSIALLANLLHRDSVRRKVQPLLG